MTPTEKARRSDALHIGNVTRRRLCDMIAELEARIDDLQQSIPAKVVARDDGARCGVCERRIDSWDKYCRWCGARFGGRV